MAKFIINGRKQIGGKITISGNKNSILPMMAACILAEEDCVLENTPNISDVVVMADIMRNIGAKIEGVGTRRLKINCKNVKKYYLDPVLVKKLRASILLTGPLLARFGKAKLMHPGGCIIGRRAVGTHFDALEALGARTIVGEEDYVSEVKRPRSAYIFLDEASVTATENVMMMASLIPGKTIIDDAACEPSIEDLASILNAMGANIEGAGTNRIIIRGSKKLHGAKGEVGPDIIDAGTFAIIAAVNRSRITIDKIRAKDLTMILLYLQRLGVEVRVKENTLTVLPSKLISPKGKIQTRPWPGFPTDLMSPLIVLATQCEGSTLCHDWMYESRMFFVDKLITMGANITLCDPHRALVVGPTRLRGKAMESPDIRAGMALVVAALCAQGTSEIGNAELIERGYEDIESRLKALGADIKRVES